MQDYDWEIGLVFAQLEHFASIESILFHRKFGQDLARFKFAYCFVGDHLMHSLGIRWDLRSLNMNQD